MKRPAFLIGAIIWTVIAALTLALLIAGMVGGWSPGFLKEGYGVFSFDSWDRTELVKEESFSLESISELSINTQYHTISVKLIDGEKLTVRQYDVDSETLFTSNLESGLLGVEVPRRNLVSMFGANISPRLEIDLPRAYADAVTLKTGSGSIRLPDAAVWGKTVISSNSGSVRMEAGISCGALEIKTTSGSVNLGEIRADSVSVATSSGTQRLEQIWSQGAVLLSSSSGSINCGTIGAYNCSIEAGSGTLRLENIETSEKIELVTTSGSINTEDLSAGVISVKTGSGTLRLDDVSASGSLDISSMSGSHNAGNVTAGLFNISSGSGTLRYDGLSGAGSVESSSGSINCDELDVKGDMSISSSSGTLRIKLASSPSFEIQIDTVSGAIRAGDIGLVYSDNRGKSAFGTVGFGENGTLSLKTSSGSINID